MHMNNCQNENTILNVCFYVGKESKTEGRGEKERKKKEGERDCS